MKKRYTKKQVKTIVAAELMKQEASMIDKATKNILDGVPLHILDLANKLKPYTGKRHGVYVFDGKELDTLYELACQYLVGREDSDSPKATLMRELKDIYETRADTIEFPAEEPELYIYADGSVLRGDEPGHPENEHRLIVCDELRLGVIRELVGNDQISKVLSSLYFHE